MKAITTGFAVTALAAAISGQAMAAEATYEFSGEINAQSKFDLLNEVRQNTIDDDVNDTASEFELTLTTTVTNGPFSGSLVIEDANNAGGAEYDAGYSDGAVDIYLDDLMVTEGNISFGQLSDVFETDALMEKASIDANDSVGFVDAYGEATYVDLSFGVTGGLRYTDEELGLKVQIEALRPSDLDESGDVSDAEKIATAQPFGASVSFGQDIGMGKVYVEAQYAEEAKADAGAPAGWKNEARELFIGVGADLQPTEQLSVVAAFHTGGKSKADVDVDPTDKADSAYAVKADFAVSDAISVYGSYVELSTETDDTEVIYVGGSYAMDMLTFSGNYGMAGKDATETKNLEMDVDYANGNISANAGYTMSLVDNNDTSAIDLSVSMMSEAGVKYKAAYDKNTNAAGDDSADAVTLSAAYSF